MPNLDGWRPPRLAPGADRTLVASLAAAAVGAALGTLLASDRAAEATPFLRAWFADRSAARNALATMLGVQITLVTIALSSTTLVYQSLVSQYSPRLFGLISPATPLYREIPLFVLSSAYGVAGIRELGISQASGVEPRPVVLGGLLLLLVALTSVLVIIIKTFRQLQVEEILRSTNDATLAALRRLSRALRALPATFSVAPSAPTHCTPILAAEDGYMVGVDLALLDQLAQRFRLVVRIERSLGKFVARGEALGWFDTKESSQPTSGVAGALARGVLLDPRRHPFLDVGFGLRVLADIAARASSPAVNDPTTALQALHRMRSVLRELVEEPLGDAELVDDAGELRVSVALPRFEAYLDTALDGPSRYGAGDPEVVSEILDLVLEIGRATDAADRRAATREVAARALADAIHTGEIDPVRLAVLREKERAVAIELGDQDPLR